MAALKILLVDDEVEFVDALAERLSVRGFDAAAAHSGPDALARIGRQSANGRYDAIVLDLRMPEMDGMEVLRRAKQLSAGTEILILTGHGTEADHEEALRLGAAGFLSKPVEINTLIDNILKACEKGVIAISQEKDDA